MFPLPKQTNGANQFFFWIIMGLLGLWLFSGLTAFKLSTTALLTMHYIMEISSIILGFIIFFITWYGTNHNVGMQACAISLVALSTSIFEIGHVLAYPGMPGVTAETLEHLWITYSLVARLIWGFGLLYTMTLPATNGTFAYYPNKTLLYSTLLVVAALMANVSFNNTLSPSLYIDRYDHPLAVLGRVLGLVADAAALIILRRYHPNHVSRNFLQMALVFSFLADLSYLFSNQTPFVLNVSSHLCKVLSYYYLLRAIFVVVIQKPYEEIMKFKDEMEELAANNAKLYQESEQQRNLIEDTLAKIGTIISSQLNLKDTLDAIADMVADMMRARQSCIALLTKDHSVLQVAATYGINTPPAVIPLQSSLAGQVLESKTALYIDDLTLHPELFRPQLIFSNIRSMICAPLVNDREVIGVIEAYSSDKAAFTERDALFLKALGAYAGAAIASAMLYEETKLRLDEEKFLYQIAQSAASTIDTDTIMAQCTTHTVNALNADMGIGFLLGSNGRILSAKATVGIDCTITDVELAAYPKLAELTSTFKPAATTIDVFPLLSQSCDKNTIKHLLILPLSVDHRLLGVIILGWRGFVAPDRLERLPFAALMAQQIALGLEKANLYNQVKAMALADGLTGLANRRNFDLFLKAELRRSFTLKRPLSLIMFDLDKFKHYNDTYGHLTGDKLLAQIGEILRHNVRSIDLPARYGGEEFSIILPECTNAEALAIAEKLRQIVEETHFPDNLGAFTARITASLGVATYDPAITSGGVPDMEDLIAWADKALYQAKQQGRNRVFNAPLVQ